MERTHKPRGHFWTCLSSFQQSKEIRNFHYDDCIPPEYEVLVSDSDDDLPASQRLAKRQRIEQLVGDFLDGRSLFIQSSRPHPVQLRRSAEDRHRRGLVNGDTSPQGIFVEDEGAIWADVDESPQKAKSIRSAHRSQQQTQRPRFQPRRQGEDHGVLVREEQAQFACRSARPVSKHLFTTEPSSGAMKAAAALRNRRLQKPATVSAQSVESPPTRSEVTEHLALSTHTSTRTERTSNMKWLLRRQTQMHGLSDDESEDELSRSIIQTLSGRAQATLNVGRRNEPLVSSPEQSSKKSRLMRQSSMGAESDALFGVDDAVDAESPRVDPAVTSKVQGAQREAREDSKAAVAARDSLSIPPPPQHSRRHSSNVAASATVSTILRRKYVPPRSQAGSEASEEDCDVELELEKEQGGPEERLCVPASDTPFRFRRLNSNAGKRKPTEAQAADHASPQDEAVAARYSRAEAVSIAPSAAKARSDTDFETLQEDNAVPQQSENSATVHHSNEIDVHLASADREQANNTTLDIEVEPQMQPKQAGIHLDNVPEDPANTAMTAKADQLQDTQAMFRRAREDFFAPSPSRQPLEYSVLYTPAPQRYISTSQPETETRRTALRELSQQPLPATQALMESWSPWSEYKKTRVSAVALAARTSNETRESVNLLGGKKTAKPNSVSTTGEGERKNNSNLRSAMTLHHSPLANGKLGFPVRKSRTPDKLRKDSGLQGGAASATEGALDTGGASTGDRMGMAQQSMSLPTFREESQLSQTIENLEATVLDGSFDYSRILL